jgi:hypothetical protein
VSRCSVLTMKLHCLQEISPSDPVEQGDEGDWDTVGEPAGGSRIPAPTVEELLAQLMCRPPLLRGALKQPLLLMKSKRLLRRKRRRLPRLDWSTPPASSAPQL